MIKIIKKILFSFFILYGFNLIASNFNIIIPINILTLLIVFFLDIPGLVLLSIILVFLL
ncbi:MAG: pro-sigmaK processing inhibitor BofA family protein [bacterium]|nr:pro-sigmaK processing inhibitor BofA family protein [bacterium]